MKSFLVRLTAGLLVPLMVSTDPVWAGFASAGPMRGNQSTNHSLFTMEALNLRNAAAFHPTPPGVARASIAVAKMAAREKINAGRRRFTLFAGKSAIFMSFATALDALAQQGLPPKDPNSVSPLNQISLEDAMRANQALANNPGFGASWHLGVPRPTQIDNVTPAVFHYLFDNSEKAALLWLDDEAAVERFFAVTSRFEVETANTDQSRTAFVNLLQGFGPSISSMVLYQHYQDLAPLTNRSQFSTPKPGFFNHLFTALKDIAFNGGIEKNSGLEAAKNLVNIAIAAAEIPMGWKDVETAGQTAGQDYQRGLNDLRFIDQMIRLKQFDQRNLEKQIQAWQDPSIQADLPPDVAEEQTKLLERLHAISPEIDDLVKKRQAIENELRRAEKWAGRMDQVAGLAPRVPHISLDRATLEQLANLKLPDDKTTLPRVTLPDAEVLREGLLYQLAVHVHAKRLNRSVLQKARELDPFSDEFLQWIMDQAWHVQGFSDSAYLTSLNENTAETVALAELLRVPAEDETLLGYPPEVQRLLFVSDRDKDARELVNLDKKSSWFAALRLNWSFSLPVRFEFGGRKVINADRITHQDIEQGILQEKVPLLIQQYMKEGPLQQLQAIRTEQLAALREARDWARQSITFYNTLTPQLNPLSNARKTKNAPRALLSDDEILRAAASNTLPVTNFSTPAADVIRGRASVIAFLTKAYGEQKNFDLLTPAGQQSAAIEMADHFAGVMRYIKLRLPIHATEEPASEPTKPATETPQTPPASAVPVPAPARHIEWPWHKNKPAAESAQPPTRRGFLEKLSPFFNAILILAIVGAWSHVSAAPLPLTGHPFLTIPSLNPLTGILGWLLPALLVIGTFTHQALQNKESSTFQNGKSSKFLKALGAVLGIGLFATLFLSYGSLIYPQVYLTFLFFSLVQGYLKGRFNRTLLVVVPLIFVPPPFHPLLFGATILLTLFGRWKLNALLPMVMSGVLYAVLPTGLTPLLALGLPALFFIVAFALLPQWRFSFNKGGLFYSFSHLKSRREILIKSVHAATRIGIGLFAMRYLTPVGEFLRDRQANGTGLSSNVTEAAANVAKIVRYAAAPDGESGRIVNNPLQRGATMLRAGTYAVAWRSALDHQFLDDIAEINTALGATAITNTDVLQTENAAHPLQHAYLQIESNNAPGSIEDTLSNVLSALKTLIRRNPLTTTAGAGNRLALNNDALSATEQREKLEISQLAKIASELLAERRWRDVKVLKTFELLPDQNQLRDRTDFNTTPLALGTQIRRDAGHMAVNFTREQARTYERFRHTPGAYMVFENERKEKRYIRPNDIKQTFDAKDRKGFFSPLLSMANDALIKIVPLDFDVVWPDHQTLNTNGEILTYVGFYVNEAFQNGTWHLEDKFKLASPPEKNGEFVSFVEIIPSGVIAENFPGPGTDLTALENSLTDLQDQFKTQIANSSRSLQNARSLGGGAATAVGKQASANIMKAQEAADTLEQTIRALRSRRERWEATGVGGKNTLTRAAAANPVNLSYPENILAADSPLEQKYRVHLGKGNPDDPQLLETIGKQVRLQISVNLLNRKQLTLESGDQLSLRIEGTGISLPVTSVESPVLPDREVDAAYLHYETSVDADLLKILFPQVANGEPPTGVFIGILQKISKNPKKATLTSPSANSSLADLAVSTRRNFFRSFSNGSTLSASSKSKLGAISPLLVLSTGIIGMLSVLAFPLSAGLLNLSSAAILLHTSFGLHVAVVLAVIAAGFMVWVLKVIILTVKENSLKKHRVAQLKQLHAEQALEAQHIPANGDYFSSGYDFFELVGPDPIPEGSVLVSRSLRKLTTRLDIIDKGKVINSVCAAVDLIDEATLKAAANYVDGLDSRKLSSPLEARTELKRVLAAQLNENLYVTLLNTYSRESLLDADTTAKHHDLRIDRELLERYLEIIRHPNGSEEDNKQAQLSLFMIFLYPIGLPINRELPKSEPSARQSIAQTDKENYLEAFNDHVYKAIAAQQSQSTSPYTLRRMAESIRRERKNRNSWRIHIQPTNPLSTAERDALIEYLHKEPVYQEVFDTKGKRIAAWRILYNSFHWDISNLKALILAAWYYVEDVIEKNAQQRTTFVKYINGIILVWLVAVIWKPETLGIIIGALIRGSTNYTLLFANPNEVFVIYFVFFSIVAFLLSLFKGPAEWLVSNMYHASHGFLTKVLHADKIAKEFKRLTVADGPFARGIDPGVFLRIFHKRDPLKDASEFSEFQEFLTRAAAMITRQLYDLLTSKDNTAMKQEYKRYFINALYLDAQDPLYPRKKSPTDPDGFFDRLKPMKLPTLEQIFAEFSKEQDPGFDFNRLYDDEITIILKPTTDGRPSNVMIEIARTLNLGDTPLNASVLTHLTRRQAIDVLRTLQAAGFQQWNNARIDKIEEKKVQLATLVMLEYPMQVLLTLISRDLTGLAFYNPGHEEAMFAKRAFMASVLKALINRLRSLAPDVYDSWRDYSRDNRMWQPIHYAVNGIRNKDSAVAELLNTEFAQVISPMSVDLTRVEDNLLQSFLKRDNFLKKHLWAFRGFLAWVRFWRNHSLPISLKKLFFLTKVIDDSVEKLAIHLLLKDPELRPQSRTDAMNILEGILIQKFHEARLDNKGVLDLQKLVSSDDFYLFDKLAAQSGMSLYDYLKEFAEAPTAEERTAIIGRFIDRLQLPEGTQSALIFQQIRRLQKSYPDKHSELLARLLQDEDASDPTLFPNWLRDKFLQDEKLEATVRATDLMNIDQGGRAFLKFLINHTPHPRQSLLKRLINALLGQQSPRAFGDQEIIVEAALPVTTRRALEDANRNSLLTRAHTYIVGVSRILLPFIEKIDARISDRLFRTGPRIETLMFTQIENYLRKPRADRRVIFTSPEINSLRAWMNERFEDSDLVLSPSPAVQAAAMAVYFTLLPDSEKIEFYSAVSAEYGEDAVREMKSRGENLIQLCRTAHLEVKVFSTAADRWVWNEEKRDYDDKLQDFIPPRQFRTIVILGSQARQKPAPPANEEHGGRNSNGPGRHPLEQAA